MEYFILKRSIKTIEMKSRPLTEEEKSREWKDHSGRIIKIFEMSNKWLRNTRDYLLKKKPQALEISWLRNELKRRGH